MTTSIEKKLLKRFLSVTITLVLAMLVMYCIAMLVIRTDVSENEAQMGNTASSRSAELLMEQSTQNTASHVLEKADAIDQSLERHISYLRAAASAAAHVYEHPELYQEFEDIRKPNEQIALGLTSGNVMEWIPCDDETDNEANAAECRKLGSLYATLNATLDENPDIALLYIVSEKGYTFGIDNAIMNRAGIETYEARTQDYFVKPLETGEIFISPVYEDSFGKGSMITVSLPITVNGEVSAVFAADILVENLKNGVLLSAVGDVGGAMLLGSDGELLCSSDALPDSVIAAQSELGASVATNNAGLLTVEDGEDTYYVVYAPVPTTGWTLAMSVSRAQVIAPALQAGQEIEALTDELLAQLDNTIYAVAIGMLALLLISLVLMFFIVKRVCRSISHPIIELADEVNTIGEGQLDFKNSLHTGDEIELLGNSFEKMTVSLKQYIENLTAVTAEKERIGAELDVATTIQASMLPCIFPAFPEHDEFSLYASMNPAKEVGGDFYDMFLVDEDHLALVIADVSGKGVPAALFMVIAKTLIKNSTQSGLSPQEVFTKVNLQLCENNEAQMFVTAWMGIMEISTGKMTCVSAGHEYPAIRRAGGSFELLRDSHGFVLAGLEFSQYEQYEMQLNHGDTLFVYTDGVPEATNFQDELLGEERMLVALNENPSAEPDEILEQVKTHIGKFVGDAPQFDDITMLCIKMK